MQLISTLGVKKGRLSEGGFMSFENRSILLLTWIGQKNPSGVGNMDGVKDGMELEG
jgi:hypothetical protein